MPARRGCLLILVLAALLPVCIASGQPAAPPRVIRVVMDDNYPPFVFRDNEGKLQGITIDQWRLWENKTGIKVEIHAMDWGDALRRMQAGEFDVIDTIFKTDERTADYDFTQPYARLNVPIFFRRDISGITDLASLQGFPVAAKTGDAAVSLLRQNGVASLLLFSNYQAIISAAAEHKVNVFVMDQPPALYYLNKLGIADDFRMTTPVNVGEFRRAVHKGNTRLLRQVEAGFADLSPEELNRIDRKWHGQALTVHPYVRWLEYGVVGGVALLALLAGWNWTLARRVRQRTRELRESQTLLAGVFDHSPSMMFVKDLNGRYLLANEHFRGVFAGDLKRLEGRTDFDLFPKEMAARYQENDRLVSDGGTPVSVEETVPHPDGMHSYVSVKFPLLNAQGRVFAVAGIATDITERKRAEAALREREAQLRLYAEHSPAAVALFDRDMKYLVVSRRWMEDYRLGDQSIIGRSHYEVFPDVPPRWVEIHRRCLAGAVEKCDEDPFPHADGTTDWIRWEIRPWHQTDGAVGGIIIFSEDITARKEAEIARRRERDFSDAVLNSLPGVVYCYDRDFRFVRWNKNFERVLGYTGEEIARMGPLDFFAAPDKPLLAARIQEVFDRGSSDVEADFLTKDGRRLPYYFTGVTAQIDGQPHLVGVGIDISEHKQAEEKIRQLNAGLEQRVAERTVELLVARDRAEAADRTKSAFLATMSHELRTPLNSIIGFTGIILQGLAGPVNPEQTRQLGMVRNSARHLLALINDVLDISKIEAGELKVESAPFDLRAIIEGSIAAIRPFAETKHLGLRLELSPAVGELTSDARRVEQILLNLLNNAVKFTERGGVVLAADIVDATVHVRVTDTGIGIKSEDLANLFRPFQQVENGLSRSHEGTGLGLAICRRLAGLLGGEIRVESAPGQGSTFTVLLPLQPSSKP